MAGCNGADQTESGNDEAEENKDKVDADDEAAGPEKKKDSDDKNDDESPGETGGNEDGEKDKGGKDEGKDGDKDTEGGKDEGKDGDKDTEGGKDGDKDTEGKDGDKDTEGGKDGDGDEGGDNDKDKDKDKNKNKKVQGAYVTANIDDDNKNGKADFGEAYFSSDNDIAPWKLPAAPKGEAMQLRFSGDLSKLKIWKDGKDWMGAGQGQVKSSFEWTSTGEDLELQVEMGGYNAKVELSVTSESRGNESYNLRASPLVLNHHLQGYERVWIVRSSASAPTVRGFEQALGSKLSVLSAGSYRNDIWLQDEIEFGTMSGMNGARINVVLNSIRNRGLDAFPGRELTTSSGRTKDWIQGVWGRGQATSGDSFGNLETSPPVTVNGKKYPLGRIYFGNRGNGKLNSELANFLKSQEIQKPFGFDTSWLCVSHVDEILTFVPAPSAPRGFLMLFGDTRAGYKMLESLPASTQLSRYRHYKTVGDMRSDRALRDRNQEIQQDALDPTLARFKKELGLSDKEIVLVPALYHDVTGCKGPHNAAALIPGTVNMVVLPGKKGEKTKLIIPDPFFRSRGASTSQDAFARYFKKLLPDNFEMHFVDDWDGYHTKHGEVHCASNVKRPPAGPWWPQSKKEELRKD